ncbi:class II histone deacetylase [Marinomonas sp. THO17]|uniref:class II histone deacetylase n=1 Tax=Marinomonas sp. THO17 TaxID=3149048 RepID=UPI00336BEBD8
MSTETGFFSDEKCFWHIGGNFVEVLPVGGWVQPSSGSGLAEAPETKRRFRNLLETSGLLEKLVTGKAAPLNQEDLLRVHTKRYLDEFKTLSDQGGGVLDPTAPMGPGSFEIAKTSAGLVYAAVESVMRGQLANAYALSRPPGHHCLPDQAMGFCFLSNIAVAIEKAKADLGLQKVAVIDWDVHHGNGTQAAFYERADVFTVSIHQDACFPPGYSGDKEFGEGAGKGYNLNIPLQPGAGHEVYQYAFETMILPALREYKPDLILVASGFDASGLDPLARMLLHSESYRWMTEAVKSVAEEVCNGRLVIAHEGGYSEAYVPFCGLSVVETLANTKTQVEDPALALLKLQQPSDRFNRFQKDLLDEQVKHWQAVKFG